MQTNARIRRTRRTRRRNHYETHLSSELPQGYGHFRNGLTLAACGGGSSSSTAAGTAGSSAASAAATGEPKAGGTLRLSYGNPIATPGYTPRATGNALLFYLNLAYENLLTYDNDGNMVPKLATEWDVNNDENSITWTLRENVKFADGEPFNAEAVKRNIEEYQANNRTETANIAECRSLTTPTSR